MDDGTTRSTTWLRAAAAWLFFVVLAVTSLLLARGSEPAAAPPPHDESARAFLQAWERFRTGTFVTTGTYHRNATDGGIVTPYHLAQAPPLRTIVQFGSAEAITLEGSEICSADPDGNESCTTVARDADYDEGVRDELSVLLGYFFANDPPLYEVVQVGPDCFELLLRRELLPAPYGLSTRFCFDAATGAVVEMVQHHQRGVDVLEITDVRTRVSEADLVPALPEQPSGDAEGQ